MESKWICYPGDFEIMLAEKVMARRYQRDFPINPFWRVDSPWHNVCFYREFRLTKTTLLKFEYEGRISVYFYNADNSSAKFLYGFNGELELAAGDYRIEVWLYNPAALPCLKIESEELVTDENFLVGYNHIQKLNSAVIGCGQMTPNTYALPVREIKYEKKTANGTGTVYDFGKLRMCFLEFTTDTGAPVRCYFGETLAEAMSDNDCELIEFFTPENGKYKMPVAKAFRFLRVEANAGYTFKAFEEYDDFPQTLEFASRNKRLERIMDVARYTFGLCSREFYLDGAKRDRWLWGGDAYQGFLMDYFIAFDREKIKRSITALFGKPPVTAYINHIMDYTLYTLMSVSEYYRRTGDIKFLEFIYPKVLEHIEFALGRTNADGFLYKIDGDWVFVDWGDGFSTDGELCFEQILLYLALNSVIEAGSALRKDVSKYAAIAEELKRNINRVFWDGEQGVYRHQRLNGKVMPAVTAYANIFAVLYGFADGDKKAKIRNALLQNKNIPPITTPYMQCYKLSCLFEAGEWKAAASEIMEYWGGMLDAGATTFWETFTKGETEEMGTEMYGRPFGRSHCHIWGASVLYLIPRYFYGIRSDVELGERFVIAPVLELIRNSEITVPLKRGKLHIKCGWDTMEILSDGIGGECVIEGKTYGIKKGEPLYVKF